MCGGVNGGVQITSILSEGDGGLEYSFVVVVCVRVFSQNQPWYHICYFLEAVPQQRLIAALQSVLYVCARVRFVVVFKESEHVDPTLGGKQCTCTFSGLCARGYESVFSKTQHITYQQNCCHYSKRGFCEYCLKIKWYRCNVCVCKNMCKSSLTRGWDFTLFPLFFSFSPRGQTR